MVSPTVDRRHGLVGSVAIKAPVTVVATTNVTLSGEQTIDGFAVQEVNDSNVPDRVLCTAQDDATQNGIWNVSTGTWTRAYDANGPHDLVKGTTVFVTDGTEFGGYYYQLTSDGPILPGSTSMTWTSVLVEIIQAEAAAAQSAEDAESSAGESAASAQLSQDWATKTSGTVDGTDYSAKQHALNAKTDRIAAESARDAALIQAGVYADEATGRAAVSNGQAFKVQGSGDVAAYEYRRVDASNSTLIATYPSLAALTDQLNTTETNQRSLNGFEIDDEGDTLATPERLRKAGLTVAAFDPSRFDCMWQDAAGTTPVTAVGQDVRRITDCLGAGYVLTYAGGGTAPTLEQTSDGRYRLNIPASSGLSSAASYAINVPALAACAIETNDTTSSQGLAFGLRAASNQYFGPVPANSYRSTGSLVLAGIVSAGPSTALGSLSRNIATILTAYTEDGAVRAQVNDGQVWSASNAAITTSINVTSTRLGINLFNSTPSYNAIAKKFYGGVYVFGETTAAQRTIVAEWLKARAGIRTLAKQSFDMFTIVGQSNGVGQGDEATATTTPWGTALEYEEGMVAPMADPTRHYATDSSGNNSGTGSAWGAFCSKYYTLTGRRVLLVGAAASGFGVATWAGATATYRNFAAAKAAAAKAYIEARGGVVTDRGFIHVGCESDAMSGRSAAQVKADIITLHSQLKTLRGDSSLQMYVVSCDRSTNSGEDAGFAAARQGLIDACDQEPDMHLVFPYADFVTQGKLEDTVHWNQEALNEVGDTTATNIADLLP